MKCPVCKEINLVITEREGIEIDYCPECRGIWLDRGELDKIIQRSAQSGNSDRITKERERTDDFDDYEERPKKRRGGFLEDLFDF